MQFSNAKGYVTDEYVYVTTQFASDVYTSEPWKDYSSHPDGLDAETKIIYEKLLMVTLTSSDSRIAVSLPLKFRLKHKRKNRLSHNSGVM